MCEAEVGTSPNGVHLGLCALLLACAFPSLTNSQELCACWPHLWTSYVDFPTCLKLEVLKSFCRFQ